MKVGREDWMLEILIWVARLFIKSRQPAKFTAYTHICAAYFSKFLFFLSLSNCPFIQNKWQAKYGWYSGKKKTPSSDVRRCNGRRHFVKIWTPPFCTTAHILCAYQFYSPQQQISYGAFYPMLSNFGGESAFVNLFDIFHVLNLYC